MPEFLGNYELLVIYDSQVLPREGEDLINSLVEGLGGSVEEVDDWGNRKFTHLIKKKEEGRYMLFWLSLPKDMVAELEEELRMKDKVLRSMLIKQT